MKASMMLVAILLPMLGGILQVWLPFKSRKGRLSYLESVVVLTSLLVWMICSQCREEMFTLAHFI